MLRVPENQEDPWFSNLILCFIFMAVGYVRLTIPSAPFFDEVHYLPAARELLAGGEWLNREHPMLGKEIIAAGIVLFGDTPVGWRIFPLLFGTAALFALMRAQWFAAQSRFASLAFGVLMATGFILFIHSRIAMLDIFMAAFFAVALWQLAAALRQPETGRWRLAIAGIALGLSMASKWNVVVLAMLPGIAFFICRLTAGRRRILTSQRGLPIPGISLVEAFVWLGIVPLLVYWLTFLPAYFVTNQPLEFGGFIAMHQTILELQSSVKQPHPYQSTWPEWMLNLRAIWYLYEPVDGAQRGVMLIGNPLTMLLGLPALVWCAYAGITRKRWDALAIVILYAVSLGMWMFADKPIQFYYHYFLPSIFLLAALALAVDEFWKRGTKWLPAVVLGGSVAIFGWFYPILSAAPLKGEQSFMVWAWLDSWR